MEAAVASLSQLKLQLVALVSEARLLRERERSAREELHTSNQRQKQVEEEHAREVRELRSELAARDDTHRKLRSRIRCLENENELVEKKEKDLQESIEGLLQSREAFIHHYEDSACSLQRAIQIKDKQLAIISEKLNTHLVLFGSVEKEAAAVKQVLRDVERLVSEKENVAAELKDKVQKISILEKDFIEKISFLENKLNDCQHELQKRARIIFELKEHLEAEKLNNKFQRQLEELRKASLVKDEIIQRLSLEKQSMHFELHNMEIVLQKFQDFVSNIRPEEKQSFSPVSGSRDLQELVNMEQVESIPATQCGGPDEHTTVAAIDKTVAALNGDCQSEIDPDSKQAQSPALLKPSDLSSPKSVTANAETDECVHESKDIVDMENCRPVLEPE